MAPRDWNRNGKKDTADYFIEYEMYKEFTGDRDDAPEKQSNSRGGMSSFRAAVIVILGFFLTAIIFGILGMGEDTPAFLVVIIWIGSIILIYCLFQRPKGQQVRCYRIEHGHQWGCYIIRLDRNKFRNISTPQVQKSCYIVRYYRLYIC